MEVSLNMEKAYEWEKVIADCRNMVAVLGYELHQIEHLHGFPFPAELEVESGAAAAMDMKGVYKNLEEAMLLVTRARKAIKFAEDNTGIRWRK